MAFWLFAGVIKQRRYSKMFVHWYKFHGLEKTHVVCVNIRVCLLFSDKNAECTF